ncbi:DoxX family protein [Leptospira semungkisensis]|uniref:DoxX family protein n=1 Tax=Leptospira semungkisensis TaxID=2484985 RepID=A0A4R9FQY7_9LEPT|nr:DoxX family protein [Leptospira semungkisensis]TGK00570.1 DoxX family protein [Leptospira semungkisensis]
MEIFKYFFRIEDTENRYTVFVRILAGGVFLWEGMIKFLYANQGVGRFTKLGFSQPDMVASFIGGLEILGGLMLILGILTRPLSIVFIGQMLVAMYMTKVPLYFGTSPLPAPQVPPVIGIWAVLHEIRSEYSQLLSCLFLFFAGPGKFSLDAVWKDR